MPRRSKESWGFPVVVVGCGPLEINVDHFNSRPAVGGAPNVENW